MTTGGCFPFRACSSGLFGLNTLNPQQVFGGYEIAYWIHMATIMGFLIYIPGFQAPAPAGGAVPNVFP